MASFYAWGRDRSLFLSRFSRADATWTSWSASECTGRIRTRLGEIKLQKWEGKKEKKGERKREREWERERESRVGILWVGRRSPPQLSFDLRRPPELPPPRTHAPLLFYPLGERFRESKVLLTVHALVLVVIVGKGMTPVRLFFHIRPPSLFPPPQHARTYRQTYASCSFFRLLFIKRIHCLVRETILLVFESLDQNGILCSSNGYNVDTTTVKRVVYYLTGTVWWCVYAILWSLKKEKKIVGIQRISHEKNGVDSFVNRAKRTYVRTRSQVGLDWN